MANTHHYFRYFTYIEPVIRIPLIRTYGSLILTIAALTIFTIFAIKPTIETILVLQKKLADQKQILASLNQKSQNLSLASANYKALVSQGIKTKIDNSVPFNPTVGELTSSLENVARVPQASISAIQLQPFEITPSTASAKPILTEIPFTYNIEGSYQATLSVLANIKNSNRLISLDTLNFNRLEGGSILLSITGKAYYLK